MNPKKKQQFTIIAIVVVVAVLAAGALVAFSGTTRESDIDYAALNPTRTDDGAFIIGNPDAPVTIIEFADFGCPHCLDYRGTVEQFIKEYVVTDQARFEFRIFPTAGGELTRFAGQVAQCMEEEQPGSFWKAYDLLFNLSASGRYNDQIGRTVSDQLGSDYSEILECAEDADQVQTDVSFGQRMGVSGTPAVMIRYGESEPQFITYNGTTFERGAPPLDVLRGVVEQAQ